MPKQFSVRLAEALNVSPAFDNCFFHSYAAHLLANKLPLPKDLFTFKSIMGPESPASQLQARFPNEHSLSLFAEYAQGHNPEDEPLFPNFIVDKTLVLGFLMREWFATQLSQNMGLADATQEDAIKYFNIYRVFRWDDVEPNTLLDGANGCLYTANKEFLEFFVGYHPGKELISEQDFRFAAYFREAKGNEDKAIAAYWKAEGYQKYFQLIANPSAKLAYHEVVPVLKMLGQTLTIYDSRDGSKVYSHEESKELPEMELKLDATMGHYFLLKTDETEPLLTEYAKSMEQYLRDRETVLRVVGNKDLAAEEQSSLLVGAICPNGHLSKSPFDSLIDKVDHLVEFVQERKQAQLLIERQRQLDEQERQRKLDEQAINQPKNKVSKRVSEAEENFNEHLRLLNLKIENLQTRKNIADRKGNTQASARLENAREAAFILHRDLKAAGTIYFNQPNRATYRTFKRDCDALIQTARRHLDQHSGWSEFLVNLALGIATAGVGVLVKGLINLAMDRSFFFVHKTDSSKKVDDLEKDVNNAAPSA